MIYSKKYESEAFLFFFFVIFFFFFWNIYNFRSKHTFQIIFLIDILLPYMVINILMPKILDYLALIMPSIIRLWQLILIRHRFVLHFVVFLIINLFYFLATKLFPMDLWGLLKFLNGLLIFEKKKKIQIFYHIIIFQS